MRFRRSFISYLFLAGDIQYDFQRKNPNMRLVLGGVARTDYWSGRMLREVGGALLLLDSVTPGALPAYLNFPGTKSGNHMDRERDVIHALRLMITPAAAKRFDRSDGICAAGRLHMIDFPVGASLRVPSSVRDYLAQSEGSDEVLDFDYEDVCSR